MVHIQEAPGLSSRSSNVPSSTDGFEQDKVAARQGHAGEHGVLVRDLYVPEPALQSVLDPVDTGSGEPRVREEYPERNIQSRTGLTGVAAITRARHPREPGMQKSFFVDRIRANCTVPMT